MFLTDLERRPRDLLLIEVGSRPCLRLSFRSSGEDEYGGDILGSSQTRLWVRQTSEIFAQKSELSPFQQQQKKWEPHTRGEKVIAAAVCADVPRLLSDRQVLAPRPCLGGCEAKLPSWKIYSTFGLSWWTSRSASEQWPSTDPELFVQVLLFRRCITFHHRKPKVVAQRLPSRTDIGIRARRTLVARTVQTCLSCTHRHTCRCFSSHADKTTKRSLQVKGKGKWIRKSVDFRAGRRYRGEENPSIRTSCPVGCNT